MPPDDYSLDEESSSSYESELDYEEEESELEIVTFLLFYIGLLLELIFILGFVSSLLSSEEELYELDATSLFIVRKLDSLMARLWINLHISAFLTPVSAPIYKRTTR